MKNLIVQDSPSPLTKTDARLIFSFAKIIWIILKRVYLEPYACTGGKTHQRNGPEGILLNVKSFRTELMSNIN